MILISPFSKQWPGMMVNAKDYPYWEKLLNLLKQEHPEQEVVQIGVRGEQPLVRDVRRDLSFKDIKLLLEECDTWIAVDNFLQHFAAHTKAPQGIVIWGISDPNIFGYPKNLNLLKSRKYLRDNQFYIWSGVKRVDEAFVKPEEVIKAINNVIKQ